MSASIDEYKRICIQFYYSEMKSFLTYQSPRDCKTFYINVIGCYLPIIEKTNYDRHGLHLVIYTIEGFEAINFKKKDTYMTIPLNLLFYTKTHYQMNKMFS